jgi:hypothetical protein
MPGVECGLAGRTEASGWTRWDNRSLRISRESHDERMPGQSVEASPADSWSAIADKGHQRQFHAHMQRNRGKHRHGDQCRNNRADW